MFPSERRSERKPQPKRRHNINLRTTLVISVIKSPSIREKIAVVVLIKFVPPILTAFHSRPYLGWRLRKNRRPGEKPNGGCP